MIATAHQSAVSVLVALTSLSALALAAPVDRPPPRAAVTTTSDAETLLLDYQKSERFKERVARGVFHLHVELATKPGFDERFPIRQTGALTVVRGGDGDERWVTSMTLVQDARRLTVISREGVESAARVVRTLEEEGLALLALEDRDALGEIEPLSLSDEEEPLEVQRKALMLGNLGGKFEVVSTARVVAEGEPPLEALRAVETTLYDGFPLLDEEMRVLGLCLRRALPEVETCLALPASGWGAWTETD